MMDMKTVVLIRKQSAEFKVNYPYSSNGNVPREYVWIGTKGNVLNEKSVPFEVFEWLKNETTTFQDGALIIKETDDEIVNDIKSNISGIEEIADSILTKNEIEKLLTTGNHLSLKKSLDTLVADKPANLVDSIKKQILVVAQDLGIDSSKKREIICAWAGLNYEDSDLFFDKRTDDLLNDNAK